MKLILSKQICKLLTHLLMCDTLASLSQKWGETSSDISWIVRADTYLRVSDARQNLLAYRHTATTHKKYNSIIIINIKFLKCIKT